MLQRYKHIAWMLIATLVASCSKDFLNQDPQSATETRHTIKDLAGLQAAINGVYSLMQNENYYGRTMLLLPDLRADNEYVSVVNSNRYRNLDQYIVTANDVYITDAWNLLYRVVANANMVIQKGPSVSLLPFAADSSEAGQIVAEAYALRGLVFFDLVRLYAQAYNYTPDASHMGIPLATTTNIEEVQSPSRSSVKDTYTQIISDLNKAISLFQESKSPAFSSGRLNILSVKALLARVLLYKGDWVAAEAAASFVISTGKYTLLPGDKLVSDFSQTGNSETIFEIINTPTDNLSTDALSYMFSQMGYGDVLATDDIWKIYNEKDARLGFIKRDRRAGTGGENPANIVTKYRDVATFAEGIKVMRLAELYLIRAEALAHLGRDADAQQALNDIVRRANPGAAPVMATGQALLDAIALERRKELAFEGHRLFDLARTGAPFIKYLANNKTISVALPGPKIILPIPQRELDANPNIRHQQNEGYN
ncbi:RagB/SusD family nutrient uptake outer membrane protein [Chitinophaga sp. HK235]|uniref:RagB/SusD family nutrient uptake outer membrane protein n=1 Tax=Chitinophaga sp. HK235 TaxID=2952571 RepID=UPI001BADE047|nr:RagB/SusD family nutrient uptake outer membrane protein [Chitinophaga sp. HK235]